MTVVKERLGRSGFEVSRIGFGALPIQRLSEAEAVALLRGALRLGVNFIDTANAYGDSEAKIGMALHGLNRDDVILATKTLARDAETILKHVVLSRTRMGVERIHLYQLHAVNDFAELEKVMAPGGAFAALQRAQELGWIDQIGITGHRVDVLIAALKSDRFATVQVPYNFIETEAEKELFPLARKLDVGIVVMKPLGGGMLNSAAISLKYILQQDQAIPIPGFETLAEIEEILAITAGGYELSAAEQGGMEAIREELGLRFCRRCNYCAPCPQRIQIPQAMILNTILKRIGLQHFITGWGKEALEKAATCTACGACAPRCPYHLPISDIIAGHVREIRALLAQRKLKTT